MKMHRDWERNGTTGTQRDGRGWLAALVLTLALGTVGCGDGSSTGADCGDGLCEAGEDHVSCPADCEPCNNDGVCDETDGETRQGCPADCPMCDEDGICEVAAGETVANCAADCYVCNNDGVCDAGVGETEADCPNDCWACNSDGTCDGDAGETRASCPADCPVCNDDGVCDTAEGESPQNCLADCPVCVVDGTCDTAAGETPINCPADCPICNNDGTCDDAAGETPINCPADCPVCDNNGVCETAFGETMADCPLDCTGCFLDGVCDAAAGETSVTCPFDCPPCNNDGICDQLAGETPADCPGDCAITGCTLSTITPPGAPSDYLISGVYLPESSAEAQVIGVDVDNDGTIDNKFGQIMVLLAQNGAGDVNAAVAADLASGALVIPAQLYVDTFPTDAVVMGLLYQGDPLASPPAFNGTDVVSVTAGTATDLYACGDLNGGQLAVGPNALLFPIPVLDTPALYVPLQFARIEGAVTSAGWTDVMIGGGITGVTMQNIILPAMTLQINDMIAADPTGSTAQTLMSLFDGNCTSGIAGCGNVIPGQGDCANNDPVNDPYPVITLTEIRCNALLDSAFAPDVDSDNDGVNDLLSVGIRVQAVSATVQLP
jgi:hypothetical protein